MRRLGTIYPQKNFRTHVVVEIFFALTHHCHQRASGRGDFECVQGANKQVGGHCWEGRGAIIIMMIVRVMRFEMWSLSSPTSSQSCQLSSQSLWWQVMSLCVAREMVVPMAMEAKAAREVKIIAFVIFTNLPPTNRPRYVITITRTHCRPMALWSYSKENANAWSKFGTHY